MYDDNAKTQIDEGISNILFAMFYWTFWNGISGWNF